MSTPESNHPDDLENGRNGLSDSSDVEQISDVDFPTYFDERNGRLYHSHPTSPYPLPVDTPEQERLIVNHNVLKHLIGSNHCGPVDTVLALNRDLPIAPRSVPENVQFELCDVNDRLRWNDCHFDIIHARDVLLGVPDYNLLLDEAARLLRPGGLFLSVEWAKQLSSYPGYDLDIEEDAPAAFNFFNTVNNTLADMHGISLDSADIKFLINNSAHFLTANTEDIHVPVGAWHENDALRTIGSSFRAGQKKLAVALEPTLLASGMSVDEVDALISGFKQEIDTVDGLAMVAHITHAERA
ncbi:hypothetical protein MD484_g856, partial [Candolleomyces efflorescens]